MNCNYHINHKVEWHEERQNLVKFSKKKFRQTFLEIKFSRIFLQEKMFYENKTQSKFSTEIKKIAKKNSL